MTAALACQAEVVGVDISQVQIEQARTRVPNATFVAADIMSLEFSAASFDAVVAFYALFHIPRDEHGLLLERIASWLRPGGYLLATVARGGHPGYTEPDFFGAPMYWSHFEEDWYRSVLAELGFELLARAEVGPGGDKPAAPDERHPLLFARLDWKLTMPRRASSSK